MSVSPDAVVQSLRDQIFQQAQGVVVKFGGTPTMTVATVNEIPFYCLRRKIVARTGCKLEVTWLKDESLEESDELPEPQDLASKAITELESVVDNLREINTLL